MQAPYAVPPQHAANASAAPTANSNAAGSASVGAGGSASVILPGNNVIGTGGGTAGGAGLPRKYDGKDGALRYEATAAGGHYGAATNIVNGGQAPAADTFTGAWQNVSAGLNPPYRDILNTYWQNQINHLLDDEHDYKLHQLPLARIKKVMKADPEVKMISAEAPILFAKGCDMFITELTMRAWIHAEENKRRTLQRSDIASALAKSDMFDFLIDIVPREDATPMHKRRPEFGGGYSIPEAGGDGTAAGTGVPGEYSGMTPEQQAQFAAQQQQQQQAHHPQAAYHQQQMGAYPPPHAQAAAAGAPPGSASGAPPGAATQGQQQQSGQPGAQYGGQQIFDPSLYGQGAYGSGMMGSAGGAPGGGGAAAGGANSAGAPTAGAPAGAAGPGQGYH